MAGSIYKLWMSRPTEAAYQLSEEERASYLAREAEDLAKVGGKVVIACDSAWSSEPWLYFGINEYPDIEAVQKHAELCLARNHFRYLDAKTLLGTAWSLS